MPVVKHGNRAATGRSGSSDVLSALGVAADLEPDLSRRCLAELKIAFLFAPRFHAGLGPASHPSGVNSRSERSSTWSARSATRPVPSHQLVGVPNEIQAELLAQVLARQAHISARRGGHRVRRTGRGDARRPDPGARRSSRAQVRREVWEPEDFGLPAPWRRRDQGPRSRGKRGQADAGLRREKKARCVTTSLPTVRLLSG